MPFSYFQKDLIDGSLLFGSFVVIIDQIILKNRCDTTESFVKGAIFGIAVVSTVDLYDKIKEHFDDVEELIERVGKIEEGQESQEGKEN